MEEWRHGRLGRFINGAIAHPSTQQLMINKSDRKEISTSQGEQVKDDVLRRCDAANEE